VIERLKAINVNNNNNNNNSNNKEGVCKEIRFDFDHRAERKK
jgi:hypothetical protein